MTRVLGLVLLATCALSIPASAQQMNADDMKWVDVVEKVGDLRFGALIVAVLASVIGTSDRTGRW
jgi:hypothetical protein